jgi:hypothetical protein
VCTHSAPAIDDLRNKSKLIVPLTCLGTVSQALQVWSGVLKASISYQLVGRCHLHCIVGVQVTNDIRPLTTDSLLIPCTAQMDHDLS